MAKISLSDPNSINIPDDFLASINEIAETMKRSRSWVISRALRSYLSEEGAHILALKKAGQQYAEKNENLIVNPDDVNGVVRDFEELLKQEITLTQERIKKEDLDCF
jgi:predicted transcriptional regulator